MNPAGPAVVHTHGGYTSTKELFVNTTTHTNTATTLAIDGMSCGHCVQAVTKALSAVAGVKVRSVVVGSAVIEAAESGTTGKAVAALEEAGYPAKAVGDVAASARAMPAKSGGGCCGGARAMTPVAVSTTPSSGVASKASGCGCG